MAEATGFGETERNFKEAVCIDAGRVFDSCCDRDCLEDLRVYFTEEGQNIISDAASVRIKSAEVIDVLINVEPVNFNRGFYSCDLTFFFVVGVEVFTSPNSCPTDVNGISIFNKKVILYGSCGNVRSFSNISYVEENEGCGCRNLSSPKCVVQAVEPIALSTRLGEYNGTFDNIGMVPACVISYIGGTLVTEPAQGSPVVYVTLGLFTIVQLIRNVQMLVPVYDFCIPEKQCDNTADQPCDVFRRIKFPTGDFFPCEGKPADGDCGCGCGQ